MSRSRRSPTRCWTRCARQSRPLDPVHAVVFLDAIVVKACDNHDAQNKPACLAVGTDDAGEKHILATWVAKTDPELTAAGAASSWRPVMTDLCNRGVRSILIARCGREKGFARDRLRPRPARRDGYHRDDGIRLIQSLPNSWPCASPRTRPPGRTGDARAGHHRMGLVKLAMMVLS